MQILIFVTTIYLYTYDFPNFVQKTIIPTTESKILFQSNVDVYKSIEVCIVWDICFSLQVPFSPYLGNFISDKMSQLLSFEILHIYLEL